MINLAKVQEMITKAFNRKPAAAVFVPVIYMTENGREYPGTVLELATWDTTPMARISYLTNRATGGLMEMTGWVLVTSLDEVVA